MKILLVILLFPLSCGAQYHLNEKLPYKARVVSDSITIKGYYVSSSDSVVTISTAKRYSDNNAVNIPVFSIKELHLKNKTGTYIGVAAASFAFGFIVTAGLTKNSGDFDNDGKTSFWELLFTAIEGTTSGNRRRRNTALIVGAAGGTTAMIIGLLTNKKLALVFPISNRQQFFSQKICAGRLYKILTTVFHVGEQTALH